jgi:Lantibiotic dehydratase, N terminus
VSGTVPLAGEWGLWQDFAVRSAGFPVGGLDAFGGEDESERLAEVARGRRFQEAVAWQNPAALANAVLKVAAGSPTKPSRARQREEIVASYWQRYCAKNDTIGFFGPLAWGRVVDDPAPLRWDGTFAETRREVHFEAWPVQTLAAQLDPDLRLAAGPRPERELIGLLEAHADSAVRERGLRAVARLEDARGRLAACGVDELALALGELDAVFTELTGVDAVRHPGAAYGGRTLTYIDCMRDVEVRMGRSMVDDVAPALRVLFEAGRWWCGRVAAVGRGVIEDALPVSGRGPFGPVMGQVIRALFQIPPALADEVAELHRRLQPILDSRDPAVAGRLAVEVFSDHEPAWRMSAFQSVDLQVAAADADALERGDSLAVVGDMHLGSNPLIQGVFAHRHPDPGLLDACLRDVAGAGTPVILPPWGPGMTAGDTRGMPRTADDMIHIAAVPETRAQEGRRTWHPDELTVDGDDLVDRGGALRVPLAEAFWLPVFISGARVFTLLPDHDHAARVTIGATALRRESWNVPATEIPARAEAVPAFARDRGLARHVFFRSPLERKPMYLNIDSPTLGRILCRHARQAAEHPGARLTFTEMLPGPDECWLADAEGHRYVSELRLVAIDESKARRGFGS